MDRCETVDYSILGKEIYSLFDDNGFRKLEVDAEYSDVPASEKYWIAIDSKFEFLTLRTYENTVIELIVTNPDLCIGNELMVGLKDKDFNKKYPKSLLVSSDQDPSGYKKYVFLDDGVEINVEVYKEVVFSIGITKAEKIKKN